MFLFNIYILIIKKSKDIYHKFNFDAKNINVFIFK